MCRPEEMEIQTRTKSPGRGVCKVFGELLWYMCAPAVSKLYSLPPVKATCDGAMLRRIFSNLRART